MNSRSKKKQFHALEKPQDTPLSTRFRLLARMAATSFFALGMRQKSAKRWALFSMSGTLIFWAAQKKKDISETHLRRTLIIHAPIDQVFDFWKNFANYPRFMSFIESVTVNDSGGLHWIIRGPGRARLEWDAKMTHLLPHRKIAWESLSSSRMMNRGVITFENTARFDETLVTVELSYAPPAGALGYAAIHILGFDPKLRIGSDLAKMSRLIEQDYRQLIRKFG